MDVDMVLDPTLCRDCLPKGYECAINAQAAVVVECPPGTCGACDYEREAGQ